LAEAATRYDPCGAIEAYHRVGEVLAARPELLATFVALGFRPLANPVLRRVFAWHITIAEACRQLGVPASPTLARLNAAAAHTAGGRVPLSILDD
jgi:hypothetical protein